MDVEERFEIKPAYLAADTAYGSADALNWIVNEKKIAPHIPVIDKSKSEDGTSREKISVRRLALHRRARGVLALEHARVGNLLAIDNPLRENVSGELEPTINF